MKLKKKFTKKWISILLSLSIAFSTAIPYVVYAEKSNTNISISKAIDKENPPSVIVPKSGGDISIEVDANLIGIKDIENLELSFARIIDLGNGEEKEMEEKKLEKYDEVKNYSSDVSFTNKSIDGGKIKLSIKLKQNSGISDRIYKIYLKNTESESQNVFIKAIVSTKDELPKNDDNNTEQPQNPPNTGNGDNSDNNTTKANLKGFTLYNKKLPNEDGSTNTNLSLSVENIKSKEDIEYRILAGDKVQNNVSVNIDNFNEKTRMVNGSIEFPKNNTSKDIEYTVRFSLKGSDKYIEQKVVVSPDKKDNNEFDLIKGVTKDSYDLGISGGTIDIELITSESIQNQSISVADRISNKVLDGVATGTGNKRNLKVTIPGVDKEETEKNYELVFSGLGKETTISSFQKNPVVKVNLNKDNADQTPVIDSVKVKLPDMPRTGGENTFTIKGSNLDKGKINIKIEKKSGDKYIDVTNEVFKDKELHGVSNIQSGTLSVPTSSKDEEYRVVVKYGDGEEKTDIFRLQDKGSSVKLGDFLPKKTFIRNGNEIVVQFFFDIHEAKIDSLKKGIKLNLYGEDISLNEKDQVSVSGDSIIIKLSNKIDESKLVPGAQVLLDERMIKDDKDIENKSNEYFIKKSVPVLYSYEFIEGEILESNGGSVKIKLNGENLSTKKVKVKVEKNQKYDSNGKRLEIKDVKLTENNDSDKSMNIEFNLPENTSDKTETYLVLLSLDGGISYSAGQKLSLEDRTKKMIPAVLPKGKKLTDQTLSFMRIHSYGTSGGSDEVPDITVTYPPIGQESKKTFIDLAGTNLDKNKTKVRLIDKNGIIWYPVNESSHDSGDRVIMINLDGTGTEGNGNNQRLEVILPRGYSGDMEFTYQVAIDGINFDDKTTVKAILVDDKEGIKPTFEEKIRSANVKYQTKNGKDVAPSRDIRVMMQLPLKITEIRPIDIDGYKYVGIKGYEKDLSSINRLKELEELEAKGKLTDDLKKEKDLLIMTIKGLEREELEKPLGERKEVVFLYEKINDDSINSEKPNNDTGNQNTGNNNSSNTGNTNQSSDKDKLNKNTSTSIIKNKNEINQNISVVNINKKRIQGKDRYETSYNISKKAFDKVENVIVVSGENFADALTAAPLTYSKNTAILLSSDYSINDLKNEIKRLKSNNINIVGGKKSVSLYVEKELKNIGSTSRISGKDRYETAVLNAEKVIRQFGNKGKVIIADGNNYPDAISIAPYAANQGIPILLANGNELSENQKDILKKYDIKEAIIVGGNMSVGRKIENLFEKSTRISGKDRYETSRKIAENLFNKSKKIFVASGKNYADALSVSYYAAKLNAPVILTEGNRHDADLLLYTKYMKIKDLCIIGGVNSVLDNVLDIK